MKKEFGAQLAAYKTSPELGRGDIGLDDRDALTVGDLCVKVLHTPGHTDDSVCFLVNDTLLFTGDTLYVGRAPKGQRPRELFDSLHHRVLSLPGDTRVWPGHDLGNRPSSTIACEKSTNSVCLMNYEDFRDRRWDGKRWVV
jgi:glyoxylase-like metal-dependent hydrolase (beta-lactamase superfamily II)